MRVRERAQGREGVQREDWIYALPVRPASVILCLGAGAAPLSDPLSGTARFAVVAVPGSRREQFRIGNGEASGNLGAVLIDGFPLTGEGMPFRSGSFDLVLCVVETGMGRLPTTWLAEARRLVRPGGGIGLIVSLPGPGVSRRFSFWTRALKTGGWNSVRPYWVHPSIQDCQWIMPIGDRATTAGCVDLLTRDRRPLRRAGFRLLSALLQKRLPLGFFAATVMLVGEHDGALAHP